jgi:hypothetical protein
MLIWFDYYSTNKSYCTKDGLVNGAKRILKITTKSNLTFEVLVEFLNSRIGQHTRTINKIFYESIPPFKIIGPYHNIYKSKYNLIIILII